MSVAERVADEMCEESIGKLVGYQIRLEAKRSSATRLLFCTTGIILRRLVEDPSLSGISHVVVDEVHERQWQIDVLLVALRSLIAGARPDLKVILVRRLGRNDGEALVSTDTSAFYSRMAKHLLYAHTFPRLPFSLGRCPQRSMQSFSSPFSLALR
jgi:hypothetical protein